jgi:hypothetical protein
MYFDVEALAGGRLNAGRVVVDDFEALVSMQLWA